MATGVSVHGQCREDQEAALLGLKSEWKFDPSYSKKMVHWNQSHECCSWAGVRCIDGYVIWLDLSNESISGDISTSSNLFSLRHLTMLDLNSNSLGGMIPHQLFALHQLMYLSLSNNLFNNISQPESEESLPPSPPESEEYSIEFLGHFLDLANNNLTGDIPIIFCSYPTFTVGLDLSFNNFIGSIPPCLLQNLKVLNLRGNRINGSIPDQFQSCFLSSLDLSNNDLGGEIPKSIARCASLRVLNVGYNNFDDVFPCMLPPSLSVLVLRFNRFHGEVRCSTSWPNLQIVDISFNDFSGSLGSLRFSGWKEMILDSNVTHHRKLGCQPEPGLPTGNWAANRKLGCQPETGISATGTTGLPTGNRRKKTIINVGSPLDYYHDEVTLTMKGIELQLVKITPEYTCIDFSSNSFNGGIPDAIGDLSSLFLLNLSHNALTGAIPRSLAALRLLEALDLSVNQLRGRIPEELAHLTFLSFLNVSNNVLVGGIPNGPQFQTFSPNSFEGNKGLCGFPLRNCNGPPGAGITPSKSKHKEIEWEFVFAALGYVVGLGSIFWALLCCRSFREPYFEKIEEVAEEILNRRAEKRREENRRRRLEMRNEFRRQQRSW
ncbi:receptor-like protein 33 [Salvia splendens]|uniref:receptor-like protein 33 n=1 Tax=Salvia splendens TaxID=180675 RepID=UPI001C264A49|nr:receptor-like protein 33 [Salvia splendens]